MEKNSTGEPDTHREVGTKFNPSDTVKCHGKDRYIAVLHRRVEGGWFYDGCGDRVGLPDVYTEEAVVKV